MKKEYDFSKAKPNRFYKSFHQGTNVVVIDPDLHRIFPTSEKVNQALHFLNRILSESKKYASSGRRT